MQYSPPLETKSFSHEICYLYEHTVQYNVHNSLPLNPILKQINPVHILKSYFFMITFNITFSTTHRSRE